MFFYNICLTIFHNSLFVENSYCAYVPHTQEHNEHEYVNHDLDEMFACFLFSSYLI